jgi:hypothetical protein
MLSNLLPSFQNILHHERSAFLFAQYDAVLVKLSFLSFAEEIQIRAFTGSNDEQLDYRFTYQNIEKELIQVN